VPGRGNGELGPRVNIKIKGTKEAVAAARREIEKRSKAFDELVFRTINVDKKHLQSLIGSGGK